MRMYCARHAEGAGECVECVRASRQGGDGDHDSGYVQLVPVPGWRAFYLEDDGGPVYSEPILGWAVCADGAIVPVLVRRRTGYVDTANAPTDNLICVAGPGEPEPTADEIEDTRKRIQMAAQREAERARKAGV